MLHALDQVQYTLRIKGARVTVSGYHDEADYTIEVEDTFARFREHDAENHLMKVADPGSMDHVEARIAGLLAASTQRRSMPSSSSARGTAVSSTGASPASTAKRSSTSPTSNTKRG